jgi:hypothetical protein
VLDGTGLVAVGLEVTVLGAGEAEALARGAGIETTFGPVGALVRGFATTVLLESILAAFAGVEGREVWAAGLFRADRTGTLLDAFDTVVRGGAAGFWTLCEKRQGERWQSLRSGQTTERNSPSVGNIVFRVSALPS